MDRSIDASDRTGEAGDRSTESVAPRRKALGGSTVAQRDPGPTIGTQDEATGRSVASIDRPGGTKCRPIAPIDRPAAAIIGAIDTRHGPGASITPPVAAPGRAPSSNHGARASKDRSGASMTRSTASVGTARVTISRATPPSTADVRPRRLLDGVPCDARGCEVPTPNLPASPPPCGLKSPPRPVARRQGTRHRFTPPACAPPPRRTRRRTRAACPRACARRAGAAPGPRARAWRGRSASRCARRAPPRWRGSAAATGE